MDRYEYPNVKGEYPTHSVTWEEAKSMCEAVGKTTLHFGGVGTGLSRYRRTDVLIRSASEIDTCNTPIETGSAGSKCTIH